MLDTGRMAVTGKVGLNLRLKRRVGLECDQSGTGHRFCGSCVLKPRVRLGQSSEPRSGNTIVRVAVFNSLRRR